MSQKSSPSEKFSSNPVMDTDPNPDPLLDPDPGHFFKIN